MFYMLIEYFMLVFMFNYRMQKHIQMEGSNSNNRFKVTEETKYINYYVFHGRVTLFFANNFLTQRRITMKFLHNFF